MTIRELYAVYIEKLNLLYDTREAAKITDWIFEDIGKITRLKRITDGSIILGNNIEALLSEALSELCKNKPVQYVLGEAWFYKLRLKVNEHVLIPRPETEELVQWIIDDIKAQIIKHEDQIDVLDIGCGSGCITIALKKNIIHSQILAIDISAPALNVAKENAEFHNLVIETRELDFLDETCWDTLPKVDIIVSNPPYIPVRDKEQLPANVIAYEPMIALFAGDDPLIFYKKIASFASAHLNSNGCIYVEIHEDLGEDVIRIFEAQNFVTELRRDIYGRQRMVKAHKSKVLNNN